MKRTSYVTPRIRTVDAREILEALGHATAVIYGDDVAPGD